MKSNSIIKPYEPPLILKSYFDFEEKYNVGDVLTSEDVNEFKDRPIGRFKAGQTVIILHQNNYKIGIIQGRIFNCLEIELDRNQRVFLLKKDVFRVRNQILPSHVPLRLNTGDRRNP